MAGERSVPPTYRFLVIQQGSQWLAQSVDFDLAAQAPQEELAVASFVRVLRAHRRRAHELGLAAFSNLPSAPDRFVRVWDEVIKTTPARIIRVDDEDEMPPAYVAEALIKNDSGFNLER
jgi:hypothetical protein